MKRLLVLIATVLLIAACAHGSGTAGGHSRSCGSAHLAEGGAVVMDGGAALRCFSAAARACKPASVRYSELVLDSGVNAKVTILPGTPCTARYVYQTWGGGGGPDQRGPKNTLICSMAVNGEHVDFTCPSVTDEIPAG